MSKIYLDTNLIDCRSVNHINLMYPKVKVLDLITELLENNSWQFCVSSLTFQELNNNGDVIKREIGLKKYSQLKHIPLADKYKRHPSRFGMARFGISGFGDPEGEIDQILIKLESLFPDKDDCRHLQTAIHNNCTYFLTHDKRTILNRLNNNFSEKEINSIKSLINIIGPDEFITLFTANNVMS